MQDQATLIISVYNKVNYLELALAAVARQTWENFEIIIADDGSGQEMKDFINNYRLTSKFHVRHIWQEDSGFRKNKILNEAIKSAATSYLIFIDGDCVPHRCFVEAHLSEREANSVLCGSRVMLSENITNSLTPEKIINGYLDKINLDMLSDAIKGKATRLEEGIFIKNELIRRIKNRKKASILGSNFSIEKKYLEMINGFNEDYIGPGLGEDTDIQFRLRLQNINFKSVKNYAILYHLYHSKTVESTENQKILAETMKRNVPTCVNGLTKTVYD